MFVSYLLLTLFHTETAMLARPGGEVSQIKYLIRSSIFVSFKFPLLSMKRDWGIGFCGVKTNALYDFILGFSYRETSVPLDESCTF